MRILIATPLFPPDIGGGSWCSKEAAYRLSPLHDVTVLTYGALPEPAGTAKVISVPRSFLPLRLARYFFTLLHLAIRSDLLYIENGASVEVPTALLSFFWRGDIILHTSDLAAEKKNSGISAWAHQRILERARPVNTPPVRRPEILPFSPPPTAELVLYERSWEQHIAFIESSHYA